MEAKSEKVAWSCSKILVADTIATRAQSSRAKALIFRGIYIFLVVFMRGEEYRGRRVNGKQTWKKMVVKDTHFNMALYDTYK
jgi:hypothetical protein